MKRFLMILIAGLVVLFLANLVLGMAPPDQWAIDAALAKCAEEGWKKADVELVESEVSDGMLGTTATVRFKGNREGRQGTIQVDLKKRFNLLGWNMTSYRETFLYRE